MTSLLSVLVFNQRAQHRVPEPVLCAGTNRTKGLSKEEVQQLILNEASHFPIEEQALLLAIAHQESNFNPCAKNPNSTASGIFQFVRSTAKSLGLSNSEVLQPSKNVRAAIQLFTEHKRHVAQRFPNARGEDRLALLYALHHDGPSLNDQGLKLAQQKVIPLYRKYLRMMSIGS